MNLEERSKSKLTFGIPEQLNTSLDGLVAEIGCKKIDFIRLALGLMFEYLDEKEQGWVYFYQKQDDASSRVPFNVPSYTYPSDPKKSKKLTANFSKQVKEKLIYVAQRYGYSQSTVVTDSIALFMEHRLRRDEGFVLYRMKPGDNSSITAIKFLFPF